jgi:hypothetical protein
MSASCLETTNRKPAHSAAYPVASESNGRNTGIPGKWWCTLWPFSTCRGENQREKAAQGNFLRRLVVPKLPSFGYVTIRYVRSPASFFVDSTFSFIFFVTCALRKPRTLWFCQSVAFAISAMVAP